MTLAITGPDAKGRATLALSGLATGRYGIQASSNLLSWTEIASGTATNGALSHPLAEVLGRPATFYRGVHLPDDPGPAVAPQIDRTRAAVGLITPESGGSLSLTDHDGTRFLFTVAPSNVVDSVPITMSLVTNFTAFPGGSSRRSAVVFSPDGFAFHGAGLLEIQYPGDLPSPKFSSYAFDGTGTTFHLVPDLVSSNRVRIPVTHFSGVGTAEWEPAGRAAVSVASLTDTRARFRNELGGILARERDNALRGNPPGTDVNAEVELRTRDYYENHLKPAFADADRDCALAKFLVREILGVARQSEMLGWPDGPGTGFLGSETWKRWECNCLQEAQDACRQGTISDRTLVRTVLGLERQFELLGGDNLLASCGLGALGEFVEAARAEAFPCLTDWIGVVTYGDSGTSGRDCSNPATGYTCAEAVTASQHLEAEVEQVKLNEINTPFFTQQTYTLTLRGTATAAIATSKNEHQAFDCGASATAQWHTTGTATGTVEIRLDFTYLNGILTAFTAAQTTALPVERNAFHSYRKTLCEGRPDPASSSDTVSDATHDLFAHEVRLGQISFTEATPTRLVGTAQGARTGFDGIPQTYRWTFKLRRR
jgi:hypothetical protein